MECAPATCATVDAALSVASSTSESIGFAVDYLATGAPWLWPMVAGFAGAIVASLIGLIVDRLPKMRGWHGDPDPSISLANPPSHCDHCHAPIPLTALIPVVGWLGSNGRAQCCGQQVPWIYPAIEAGTAVLSIVIIGMFGANWNGLAGLLLLWGLLLASWLDIAEHEIPDFITFPLLFIGLAASPLDGEPMSRIIAAMLAGGLTWSAFKVTSVAQNEDAMSYGDVMLATALSAWVGLCGAIWFLLAACAVYIAYAAPLRTRGVVWVPMGPALAAGFAITALVLAYRS